MKHIIATLSLLAAVALYSCSEEPVGQQPLDGSAPAPVTNVQWTATPGGATITYSLPADGDLLYVKAVYTRNGEECESRASYYRAELNVEGFGDDSEREVILYAVDRSENRSAPVPVKIKPLKPALLSVWQTLALTSDFGGVTARWTNPTRANMIVVVQMQDEFGEYNDLDAFYSATVNGKGSHFDMDTIPAKFRVYMRDHWGNRTETRDTTLTPLYATVFDREKMSNGNILDDGPEDNFQMGGINDGDQWLMYHIFDGIWDGREQGYKTQTGKVWPQSFTVNLGVTGRVSRIRIHQRTGSNGVFAGGNIRRFELYGGGEDIDKTTGTWDQWTLLGSFESVKPSGMMIGSNTGEDEQVARNGEDFTLDALNSPKIRYLRFRVTKTWGNTDYLNLSELEVFGDPR